MRGELGEHFISLSGPVNWPPISNDLTPLHWFCGAMLKLISVKTSSDTFENNIIAFIRQILAEMLEGICRNRTMRRIIRAQSWKTFAWNNLQIINYMHCTINLKKKFMHFLNSMCVFKCWKEKFTKSLLSTSFAMKFPLSEIVFQHIIYIKTNLLQLKFQAPFQSMRLKQTFQHSFQEAYTHAAPKQRK